MRDFNTKSDGKSFDEATIEAVWQKGTPEPAHAGFRKDFCGASMQRTKYGKLTENGWRMKGTIYGGGPFVSKDKVYVLDVGDVPGETLKIKLTPPANFWSIDRLAVDYSEDVPVSVTEVGPSGGVDHKGRDVRASLAATDGSYLVMSEMGESAELTFDAPPRIPQSGRTVILKASGYYKIHVETAGIRPRLDIIQGFASEPGSTIRFAMNEYLEWKAENDANSGPVKTDKH